MRRSQVGPLLRCRPSNPLSWLAFCSLIFLTQMLALPFQGDAAWGLGEPASPPPAAQVLLISNSPETVRSPGILFQHSLEEGIRYRLFFHHLNGTGANSTLRISLEGMNTEDEGGLAWGKVAGTAVSPYAATSGWQAAQAYTRGEGENFQLLLSAGEEQTLWSTALAPHHVATGYILLEVQSPALLRVRLGEGDHVLDADGIHERGWVMNPQIEREIPFSLSQKTLEISFGASRSIHNASTGNPLRGDYGIDHLFHVVAHNPYDVPMPLHLVFIPRGGDGRLLLLVDGEEYVSPRTFSGHYYHLRRWVIHPGQRRTISLWTTPIAAMGYPAILRLSTYLDSGWPRHPTSPH